MLESAPHWQVAAGVTASTIEELLENGRAQVRWHSLFEHLYDFIRARPEGFGEEMGCRPNTKIGDKFDEIIRTRK